MIEDDEIDSVELRAAEDLIDGLANGDAKAVVKNLRLLQYLDGSPLSIFAGVLDGTAPLNLFPWTIKVQRPGPGRPPCNVHKREPKLFALICARKMNQAAKQLRTKGKLHAEELQRLADLLDDSEKKLPWRLAFKYRRRGRPFDTLQSRATAFKRSLLVNNASEPKLYLAIEHVMAQTGLSKSTIQKARQRSRQAYE
jgi:hypothetical protein